MPDLKPEEKMILFRIYALIALIIIVVAFLLTPEQWFWLIAVGIFIVILFCFFSLCNKLNTKYVKNLPGEETNDQVMAIIKKRSMKRILRYAEQNNKSPAEVQEILERDAQFIKENSSYIATFYKIQLSFGISIAIGYISYLCAHFILKIHNSSDQGTADFIGVIVGSISFIGISLYFIACFFKKVRQGMKEAQKHNVIIRK